jgi:PadR family transcriptional regulator PadR
MGTPRAVEGSDQVHWPSNWLRATLPLAVLQTLDGRASYGYALIQILEDAGLGCIKAGTLYPILARLETNGWIVGTFGSSRLGPARKYFQLTEDGRLVLEAQRRQWHRFTEVISTHIEPR